MKIPFNKPYMTGKELWYISQAHHKGMLAGDGDFTKKCHAWLEKNTGSMKALLTHSCTAALEMAAILADIQPGDEVIMPSYTFVSTANAVVLRGGKETLATNGALAGIIRQALRDAGIPGEAVQFIDTPDRQVIADIIAADEPLAHGHALG